jgi:hypothetical protein
MTRREGGREGRRGGGRRRAEGRKKTFLTSFANCAKASLRRATSCSEACPSKRNLRHHPDTAATTLSSLLNSCNSICSSGISLPQLWIEGSGFRLSAFDLKVAGVLGVGVWGSGLCLCWTSEEAAVLSAQSYATRTAAGGRSSVASRTPG